MANDATASDPRFAAGTDHINAKTWVIVSPNGTVYECRNLMHWLREHEDMLDGTARQAWDGITKIKYSMQGKRKYKSSQWKGWQLLRWGEQNYY